MTRRTLTSLLLPTATVLLAALPSAAQAASSAYGEEYLATGEYAEPNILFVVDRHYDMATPCDSTSTEPCIETVKDAILQVVQHYDWARYGIVGTSTTVGDDDYYPIAPIGSSYAEMAAALATVTTTTYEVRNHAEVLEDLGRTYFSETSAGDGIDDDGDGIAADWDDAPILYDCQETHIIVLTRNRPRADNAVSGGWTPSITPDITCQSSGIVTSGPDTLCKYDNVAYKLYNTDLNGSLSGDQNATLHTVGIDISTTSLPVAEALYGNASDVIGGAGTYNVAGTADEVLGSILTVMQDIRTGTFSRSTPVVTSAGDYIIYSYYELTGDNPLAEGHIRGYQINDDPESPNYGQIVYDATSPYGGAVWDGGDLLVSRPVPGSEYNPADHDGVGYRDIYTFFEEGAALAGLSSSSEDERRQPLDKQWVTSISGDATARDLVLDWDAYTSTICVAGVGPYVAHDFNTDCAIDASDMQELVDFVRGRPDSTFRYIDQERGYWKLGDAPYGVPAIVEPRLNNAYSMEASYRTFLSLQQAADYPRMVFQAANDGMLHAFYVDDESGTAHSEAGEEAWAWIPGYLLYHAATPSWSGRAIDQMLYGRTFLFDGSPVVADVWIDHNNNQVKECNTIDPGLKTWADCEWHRVIVVQQGKGGPLTMALDITNPLDPQFLWEQWDETEEDAQGYGVGRAVIAQVRDTSDSALPTDRYIAIWGSGRAVPYSSGGSGFQNAEANLYVWDVGEGPYVATDSWPVAGYSTRGDNDHPEAGATLDIDSDGAYEQAYIGAALAVIDHDSDGDADTVYFPVSTTYTADDESGGSGPAGSGDIGDPTYISDPGSTYMYKACFESDDLDDLTWVEFYDPVDDSAGVLDRRPEIYYAATTSWHGDGSLGVYWGTGSPFDRSSSDEGYFFAVRDTNPGSCASFTAEGIAGCGAAGVYPLAAGEGLTGDPIVYAGVIYFSTWTPGTDSGGSIDMCEDGVGQIYGITYNDCSPGMDTNGDGLVDGTDDPSITADGYVSGITVTEQGNLVFGIHDSDMDGTADIGFRAAQGDPFLGTATYAWMEVF